VGGATSAIGPAGGFLLFLLGIWLLVRTVRGNLVKHLLGG
jgi:hypothetical protein